MKYAEEDPEVKVVSSEGGGLEDEARVRAFEGPAFAFWYAILLYRSRARDIANAVISENSFRLS